MNAVSHNGVVQGHRPHKRRRIIILLSVLLLFEGSLYSAITPLLPHYAETVGLSQTAVGILAATYTLGLMAGAIAGTWVARRIGVRRMIVIGVVVFAGSTMAFGFAANIVTLDLLRGIQGCAAGCVWGGALAWAIGLAPSGKRGGLVGTVLGAGVFGSLLGPVIGTAAIASDTATVFALVGAAALGIGLWVFVETGPALLAREVGPPIPSVIRHRSIVVPTALMLLNSATVGATSTLIPLRMAHLGASGIAIGVTFVVAMGAAAMSAPGAGYLADRFELALPTAAGLLLAGALLVLAPMSGSTLYLGGMTVALFTVLTAVWMPVTLALTEAADALGATLPMASMLITVSLAAGETVGAPAGASLAQATSDDVPFIVLGMMTLGAAVLLVGRIRREADASPGARG